MTALRVYLERGEQALTALESGDIEEFFAQLDKRRAAFHNFRAIDHLARTANVDLAQEPGVKQLWEHIQAVNSRISSVSTEAVLKMEDQVSRLVNGRTVSLKYGSGLEPAVKLRKYS
jgi:hypothetical protein